MNAYKRHEWQEQGRTGIAERERGPGGVRRKGTMRKRGRWKSNRRKGEGGRRVEVWNMHTSRSSILERGEKTAETQAPSERNCRVGLRVNSLKLPVEKREIKEKKEKV